MRKRPTQRGEEPQQYPPSGRKVTKAYLAAAERKPRKLVRRTPPKVRKWEYLNPDQVVKLLKAAARTDYFAFYAVLATADFSPARVAVLEWEDIDFAKKQITSRQTFDYVGGKPGAKSCGKQGPRQLPAIVFELLETHRNRQRRGGYVGPYVFVTQGDRFLLASSTTKAEFDSIHRTAQLPGLELRAVARSGRRWLRALFIDEDSTQQERNDALQAQNYFLQSKLEKEREQYEKRKQADHETTASRRLDLPS